jgi:hypothetical protein
VRIKIDFGLLGTTETVNWYKDIADFPRLLRYQGNVYEFVMYQPTIGGYYDHIFTFSLTTYYGVSFYEVPSFVDLFGSFKNNSCQCGAKFDKDFPNIHMFFLSRLETRK